MALLSVIRCWHLCDKVSIREMVPAGYVSQAILVVQTDSNISDITNPDIDNRAAAEGLDKVSTGAAVIAIAIAPDVPHVAAGAAIVDETATVSAFVLNPNLERTVNVLTICVFGALEAATHGYSEASETVGMAEKSTSATDILQSTLQYLQNKQQSQSTQPPPPLLQHPVPRPVKPPLPPQN